MADATQFISFAAALDGTFLLDEPLPTIDESLGHPVPARSRPPLKDVPTNANLISPSRIRVTDLETQLCDSQRPLTAPHLDILLPTTKVTAVRRKRKATTFAEPIQVWDFALAIFVFRFNVFKQLSRDDEAHAGQKHRGAELLPHLDPCTERGLQSDVPAPLQRRPQRTPGRLS